MDASTGDATFGQPPLRSMRITKWKPGTITPKHTNANATSALLRNKVSATPSTMNTSDNSHLDLDGNTVTSVDIDHPDDSQSVSSVSCNSSVNSVDGQHSHSHGQAHNEQTEKQKQETLLQTPKVRASKSMDFEMNSPTDAAIGIRGHSRPRTYSENDSLQFDEIMHMSRNQLIEENNEYNLNIQLSSDEFEVVEEEESIHSRSRSDSQSVPRSDSQSETQMQVKDSIIQCQRNELQQYNTLIRKYRGRIREKNQVIQSMEKSLEQSKDDGNLAVHQSVEGTDFSNAESSCDQATLEAVQSELRTYRQIIAALTDENNSYRKKDMARMETINNLGRELMETKSRNQPSEQEMQRLKDDVEMKTNIAESIMTEMTALKENDNGNQIQIAELGQKVIRIEKVNISLEEENKTLQKLLSTSREAVINRSTESLNESHSEIGSVNVSFQSINGSVDLVEGSLRNQLEATKKREAYLLKQMTNKCQQGDDRDAIMESLAESQQEAIAYLSTELETLRTKVAEEQDKFRLQFDVMKITQQKMTILERENKLVVSESIRNEMLLEMVRQDLSMKSGENACLRDEVSELEEKSTQLQALEASLKEREEELRQSQGVHRDAYTQPHVVEIELPKTYLPPRSPFRQSNVIEQETMSEAGDTFITVEIDNDNNDAEAEIIVQTKPSDQVTVLRKFHVLKKALKQKYEKKQKDLEQVLQIKDAKLERLVMDLESQKHHYLKQQSELERLEINRISNEAEMYEQIVALQASMKESDSVMNAMKVKMHRLQDKCDGEGGSWNAVTGISDALIDGVGKSIALFESMSFASNESEDAHEDSRTNAPPPFNASKSFGY